jgi:hypothetical protein
MGIDVAILFSGRALDFSRLDLYRRGNPAGSDGSYHSFWRLREFCRMESCGPREMMV